MRKKGQAAMEYLMTYGWAILIIIVVIAALYGMGVFKTKATVPCNPCFGYFAYVDHNDNSLVVKNGPRGIESLSSSTGTPGSTTADPGVVITISGATIADGTEVELTYTVTESGLVKTDNATLNTV